MLERFERSKDRVPKKALPPQPPASVNVGTPVNGFSESSVPLGAIRAMKGMAGMSGMGIMRVIRPVDPESQSLKKGFREYGGYGGYGAPGDKSAPVEAPDPSRPSLDFTAPSSASRRGPGRPRKEPLIEPHQSHINLIDLKSQEPPNSTSEKPAPPVVKTETTAAAPSESEPGLSTANAAPGAPNDPPTAAVSAVAAAQTDPSQPASTPQMAVQPSVQPVRPAVQPGTPAFPGAATVPMFYGGYQQYPYIGLPVPIPGQYAHTQSHAFFDAAGRPSTFPYMMPVTPTSMTAAPPTGPPGAAPTPVGLGPGAAALASALPGAPGALAAGPMTPTTAAPVISQIPQSLLGSQHKQNENENENANQKPQPQPPSTAASASTPQIQIPGSLLVSHSNSENKLELSTQANAKDAQPIVLGSSISSLMQQALAQAQEVLTPTHKREIADLTVSHTEQTNILGQQQVMAQEPMRHSYMDEPRMQLLRDVQKMEHAQQRMHLMKHHEKEMRKLKERHAEEISNEQRVRFLQLKQLMKFQAQEKICAKMSRAPEPKRLKHSNSKDELMYESKDESNEGSKEDSRHDDDSRMDVDSKPEGPDTAETEIPGESVQSERNPESAIENDEVTKYAPGSQPSNQSDSETAEGSTQETVHESTQEAQVQESGHKAHYGSTAETTPQPDDNTEKSIEKPTLNSSQETTHSAQVSNGESTKESAPESAQEPAQEPAQDFTQEPAQINKTSQKVPVEEETQTSSESNNKAKTERASSADHSTGSVPESDTRLVTAHLDSRVESEPVSESQARSSHKEEPQSAPNETAGSVKPEITVTDTNEMDAGEPMEVESETQNEEPAEKKDEPDGEEPLRRVSSHKTRRCVRPQPLNLKKIPTFCSSGPPCLTADSGSAPNSSIPPAEIPNPYSGIPSALPKEAFAQPSPNAASGEVPSVDMMRYYQMAQQAAGAYPNFNPFGMPYNPYAPTPAPLAYGMPPPAGIPMPNGVPAGIPNGIPNTLPNGMPFALGQHMGAYPQFMPGLPIPMPGFAPGVPGQEAPTSTQYTPGGTLSTQFQVMNSPARTFPATPARADGFNTADGRTLGVRTTDETTVPIPGSAIGASTSVFRLGLPSFAMDGVSPGQTQPEQLQSAQPMAVEQAQAQAHAKVQARAQSYAKAQAKAQAQSEAQAEAKAQVRARIQAQREAEMHAQQAQAKARQEKSAANAAVERAREVQIGSNGIPQVVRPISSAESPGVSAGSSVSGGEDGAEGIPATSGNRISIDDLPRPPPPPRPRGRKPGKAGSAREQTSLQKIPRSERYWLDQQSKFMSDLVNLGFEVRMTSSFEYECSLCLKRFNSRLLCIRHAAEHLSRKAFWCIECGLEFTRCDTLQRHYKGRCEKRITRKEKRFSPFRGGREWDSSRDESQEAENVSEPSGTPLLSSGMRLVRPSPSLAQESNYAAVKDAALVAAVASDMAAVDSAAAAENAAEHTAEHAAEHTAEHAAESPAIDTNASATEPVESEPTSSGGTGTSVDSEHARDGYNDLRQDIEENDDYDDETAAESNNTLPAPVLPERKEQSDKEQSRIPGPVLPPQLTRV